MTLENVVNKLEKTYVIATAQYNSSANKQLLSSMDKYCITNNAEIIILPTTGKSISEDQILSPELEIYKVINKDYNLNNNLRIKDFGVRPQQINPLTGLERFAQGDKSYIMPGTKQVLKYVANSYDVIPKAIMTTGSITNPVYNTQHRIGRIAQQDHQYGFVVVEIENSSTYHFRHVRAMKNGKFIDLGVQYDGNKKPKKVVTEALIVGDLHPYDTNAKHEKNSFKQIGEFNPKAIFLHDTFNGKSISHHYKNHNIRKNEVANEQGLNLEDELKYTNKAIIKYADKTAGTVYIVASNHDEHLFRYLDEGRFIGDKHNDLIGSILYTQALQGVNPLEYGLNYVKKLPYNIKFLNRDEDFKIRGFQLAHHGDLGSNGGRGSPRSIEHANGKSITGHSHSPLITRNTYKVGTSTNLRLDYNRGYSNWVNTNAVLYEDGSVQLLNTIKGSWKGK